MSKKEYLRQDDIHKDRLTDIQSLLYLLKFSSKHRYKIIIHIGILSLSSLCVVFSARLLGHFVDHLKAKSPSEGIYTIVAGILLCELLSVIFSYFGRKGLIDASLNSILKIRHTLFNHFRSLPLSYFDREPLGRTITRITHDVESLERFFSNSIAKITNAIAIFFIIVIAMISTDLKMGLIISFSFIPIILITIVSRKAMRWLNREMSKRNSIVNSQLSEFINALPIIRIFSLENWSLKKYQDKISKHLKIAIKFNRINALVRPFISLLCTTPLLLLLFIGGANVIEGSLGLGMFVTFIRFCERFNRPMIVLAAEIHTIQESLTCSDRITQFLFHETEKDIFKEDSQDQTSLSGKIGFQNIFMKYQNSNNQKNDQWILNDVNFTILPGEKIGLVGTTGSGKTSTVNLISRLYPFQKGQILLDDVSIEKLSKNKIREQIGFVSQDVILFKSTLRDNLSCGFEFSDQSLIEGCQKTGLWNRLQQSSLNLDSEVFEKGENFSVGERQLISLTRIFIHDPKILILDEATANIDPHFEAIIQEAINKIMVGRTCLIIAHRLNTLKGCDRLLVFEQGKLIEQGSHTELISQKGKFFDLIENSKSTL